MILAFFSRSMLANFTLYFPFSLNFIACLFSFSGRRSASLLLNQSSVGVIFGHSGVMSAHKIKTLGENKKSSLLKFTPYNEKNWLNETLKNLGLKIFFSSKSFSEWDRIIFNT